MKEFKNIICKTLLFLTFFAVVTTCCYAQTNKKDDKILEVKNLINSGTFSFIAQSAMPMGGRTIDLTPEYNLKVSKETITADLPYFGRAYTAPIDPTEGGIRFSSSLFDYNIKNGKKGGWEISIVPKDTKDVRQAVLSVSSTGYSTLQVLSNNRQAISFRGYITAKK